MLTVNTYGDPFVFKSERWEANREGDLSVKDATGDKVIGYFIRGFWTCLQITEE